MYSLPGLVVLRGPWRETARELKAKGIPLKEAGRSFLAQPPKPQLTQESQQPIPQPVEPPVQPDTVPPAVDKSCPPGYVYSEYFKQCVSLTAYHQCAANEYWDGQRCNPNLPSCPEGYWLDRNTGTCIPLPGSEAEKASTMAIQTDDLGNITITDKATGEVVQTPATATSTPEVTPTMSLIPTGLGPSASSTPTITPTKSIVPGGSTGGLANFVTTAHTEPTTTVKEPVQVSAATLSKLATLATTNQNFDLSVPEVETTLTPTQTLQDFETLIDVLNPDDVQVAPTISDGTSARLLPARERVAKRAEEVGGTTIRKTSSIRPTNDTRRRRR